MGSSNIRGYHIYTDGACKGNPGGDGGWGALVVGDTSQQRLYGGEKNTTNNRMEMMATIKGLESVPAGSSVTLFTDSEYVRQGITSWIHNWKKRGWMTATKQPVKNQDLWKRIDALCQTRNIDWKWVKGHNGNPGNEEADRLANLGVQKVRSGELE